MNYQLYKKILAAIVFITALYIFYSTAQPSVSFWDPGERIAASYYLQIPHPPGAPFFILTGRIFSMLPFAENVGLRVNTISVIASGLSVLLLFLIAVKLIENYRGKNYKNLFDASGTYFAAAIGAFALAFSQTFWFNAVEAETYALATFFFILVIYLMMRWHERADKKDNEKYILMIAYLVGLSTGIHLMAVLAAVPVLMIIIFRKYVDDEETLKKTAKIFLIHAAVIFIFALAMWGAERTAVPPAPEEYKDFDTKFKVIALGLTGILIVAMWRKLLNRNSFYLPLFIGGLALAIVYPGVVKYYPALITSISGNNVIVGIVILLATLTLLGLGARYSIKENKSTLHLAFMSLIFVIISFTTYTMVIIRANHDTPMNQNDPSDLKTLVSYLNREQYGDFPTFKRRFSAEPHQQGVYTNYSSDLDFFWSYQMNHMMTRYLLWNFAGREGWSQDDGVNIAPFNQIGNFFGKIFNIRFNGDTKNSLFGIPFLLGLIGIYFHFRRDWKMASVFLIMFIFMGYLTAFYQNQQQPQPRERDYFYAGAYFVFAIWIAIAIRGFIDIVQAKVSNLSIQNAGIVGVIAVGFVLIPFVMLRANYSTNDRSSNWIPWDYSYNLLQSCAPNAVLFTNGDNDTFPLWYLQDVEGVRRDVKVANLSLLNTPWYIKQLKSNDPYNVGTVRIRMGDSQIDQIRPIQWEPQEIKVPVPKTQPELSDLIQRYNVADTSVIHEGFIKFRMDNTLTFGNIKAVRVQDLIVKEIVEANNWQRPIYFAVTCSDDSKIGLQDYLRMEGMAFRLVPEKRKPGVEFINEELVRHQLQENPEYSKEYDPRFKFRGINDPELFFDENQRRLVQNYRNAFMRLTLYYINTEQYNLAVQTLDSMEEKIPRHVREMPFGLLYEVGNLYLNAGAVEKYVEYAREVEEIALINLERNPEDVQSYYNPYRVLMDIYENLEDHKKAYELWQRIALLYPNDPSVKSNVEKYKELVEKENAPKDSVSR